MFSFLLSLPQLQPVFSFLLSMPLNWITHQSITLTTMSLSEPERTPDVPSSPIARKQRNWNAFPVTPSPTKNCGSKHQFVDNEPFCNAWKTSHTTPPTKVTDDPYFNTTEKQQMETMWHKTGPTDLINNSWEFRGSSSPRAASVLWCYWAVLYFTLAFNSNFEFPCKCISVSPHNCT